MRFARLGRLSAVLIVFVLGLAQPSFGQTNVSYTAPNGVSTTITEWNTCRRVYNGSSTGKSIFVPTKFNYEWINSSTSFLSSTIPGVTNSACMGGALRFRSANSNYLSRTPGSAGNRQTWTQSFWFKRGNLGVNQTLFTAWSSSSYYTAIEIGSGDALDVYSYDGGYSYRKQTSALLRDPSAWYHLVVSVDTTQALVKVYLNGALVTSFANSTNPSTNYNTYLNSTSYTQYFGRRGDSSIQYFDGYMADVYFIDGQALTPTSFGQYDATTGKWEPATYSGSYGTNGFHLDFNDPGNLGGDVSGQSNNWTPNNFSVTAGATYDPMEDYAALANNGDNGRGNYATLNVLDKDASQGTLSNGNLDWTTSYSAGNAAPIRSTAAVTSGKWYVEYTVTTAAGIGNQTYAYITSSTQNLTSYSAQAGTLSNYYGADCSISDGYVYQSDIIAGYGTLFTGCPSGTVMSLAYDVSAGNYWVGKNGTWYNSGNPAAGTNATGTFNTTGPFQFGFEAVASSNNANRSALSVNFGQRAFAYTPPAGFSALNTYNISAPSITTPSAYMSVTTYTGNGSYMSVGNPIKLAGSTNISDSLRFRSANSPYLTWTPGGAGNQKTWTLSLWHKRGLLSGVDTTLMSSGATPGANGDAIQFDDTGNNLRWFLNGASSGSLVTNQQFRDPSAWMHLVFVVDTTQATANNRMRIYINGVQITSFSTQTQPAQNYNTVTNSAVTHKIGFALNYAYLDGYLADVYFIDGQALTPSSFAATDANGNWAPATYGGSYGTNGFHLQFLDNSNTTAATLGADTSGNGNNWTPNNFSVTAGSTNDVLRDTPTPYSDSNGEHGNYATLNPLDKGSSSGSLSDGNLTQSGSSNASAIKSTFGIPPGKWYWESTNQFLGSGGTAADPIIGLADVREPPSVPYACSGSATYSGYAMYYWGSNSYVQKCYNGSFANTSIALPSSPATSMFAYDANTGKLWFGVNGTWADSGNPAAGTNPEYTLSTSNMYTPTLRGGNGSTASTQYMNFGQRAFAYTPPTGFKALSTYNIANSSFVPDLVIIKDRSSSNSWGWYDTARGATLEINSDTASAQAAQSGGLLSFQNGGFTVGSEAALNTSGDNYVAYMFKKGVTPGFDIETYTGNGANRTVAHALGSAPSLMMIKDLTAVDSWRVYSRSIGAGNCLILNLTNGSTADATVWNSTDPTSSVFSLGTAANANTNGNNYIAYLFAPIPGFSAFGSYTGNGSADGPFVYTGFQPAFVLIKEIDTTRGWVMFDNGRDPYNMVTHSLMPYETNAESTGNANLDFLSNGFKLRNTDSSGNYSGGSYIYAAFAQQPFKYANAR